MKRPSAPQLAFALALTGAALSVGALHCSTPTNYGSAFVGTWSCPASLSALGSPLVITENLDDSLTLTSAGDAGGNQFCPTDNWSYTGSSASMPPGTECTAGTGNGDLVKVNSFTLSVSGSKLTVTGNETVITGSQEADGATGGAASKSTLALSGSCTKQ